MTTDKILKMLEDPESDNDEVNARIWCFENKVKYRGVTFVRCQTMSVLSAVKSIFQTCPVP